MRILSVLTLALAAMLPTSSAIAADTSVKSKIVGVDLFKNGLAIVKREATLGKAGNYTIDDVPQPIHGTFWIDSTGTVDVMVKMRDVEVPASEVAPGSLQDDLAGKKVTIHFKGDKRVPVTGTMLKIKPQKGEEIAVGRYLVLQTGKGRVYVEPSEVAAVESDDAGDKVIRRRPQLVLALHEPKEGEAKAETKVTIRYIAHGLSWSPSYRLDISDPKMLLLEQHATIRNELGEFDGAEVRLISGYPSVQFAHVRSLLSPRTTWASFFAELAGNRWQEADVLSNSIVAQQQVSLNTRGAFNLALGATPAGEGVDLHYQSIGKRTMSEGDTLALTVAKGKADYERIVEWLIPDTRDIYGRLQGGDGHADDVWDALKFKNPLAFPMTTGPAMVTANGQFNGQRTSYWVNSGEETVLRVEKSLSIRTRATENEKVNKEGGGYPLIWIGGRQYRQTTVEGELMIGNHRKESVTMVIRRRFSGELTQAEGEPKQHLLAEGIYSVNKRQELLWTVSLKGGEEKKLKYTYTVLVPH